MEMVEESYLANVWEVSSNKSGVEEHTILCIESGTTISTMHITIVLF